MKNDLEIKQILNKYPGVKIHSINNISETSDEIINNDKILKSKEK